MAVEGGAVAEKPALGVGQPEGVRPDGVRWDPLLELPCELSVDLPLPSFRIADLLKLRAGSVINTGWHLGNDVPLRINGTLIGWSEFEVVNERLAVRLTELA
jgi:flagellar motor switch protein FliN/FliY